MGTAESFDLAAVVVDVRSALAIGADPDDAEPMAAYMKNRFPFLGSRPRPGERPSVRS